ERTPKYTAEELYSEKLMFHGPRFQGVFSLDRLGEDGVLGQLEALPSTELFRNQTKPLLITDPFLLDAAGQLIGYWPLEYLETDFVVFPIGLSELRLYGPKPNLSERFRCHVRIRKVTSKRLRADVDILGSDNTVRMCLIGWENWRFYCTSQLYSFWRHPKDLSLSVSWDSLRSKFPLPESFEYYRLDMPEPAQFILKDPWVYLLLNGVEREAWRNLKGPEAHQAKWLIGRWVAKDAVRMFLRKHHDIGLYPADIEIAK
ncbi:unnamed protein product, partial [marine sediment metagenome]